uniref:PSI domain-containing protein n=1 Tax=Anopheles minimus TaxID=112268 RepID=A0A182WAX5_9DIPT
MATGTMRTIPFIRNSLFWLILLSLYQQYVCEKVPRKYLQTDLSALGSSFSVPVSVPAPSKANDTALVPDVGGAASNRSVVPLDESKKSFAKLKLYQEQLNGKKAPSLAGSVSINEDTTHLLGFNGTGQRKEYAIDGDSVNKTALNSSTKLLGAAGLNTSLLQESPGRDPISDAINIDTIERTEAELNSTLQEHNITKTFEDNHLYYKSTWSTDQAMSDEFWKKITTNLTVNMLLSNSHRRATVCETFIVVWENVILQDRPNNGTFTFSVTLNKSGDIVFAYKKIPISIQQIFENPLTKNHPVKIGLSDAYIIDKTIMRTKQKTIYEYHRVNFGQTEVQNDTIITLSALPTCFSFKDCESCITHEGADFECLWCPTINRCSTGTDRKRQDWVHKGCDTTMISEALRCPALGQKGNNYGETVEATTKNAPNRYNSTNNFRDNQQPGQDRKPDQSGTSNGVTMNGTDSYRGAKKDDIVNKTHVYHTTDMHSESSNKLLVSLLVFLGIVSVSGCWVLYAYRNPHTKSGQLLIRYRPNKWLWRRGEARYTAASIHM